MGCCCCKPPAIELVREDPTILGCVKATRYGEVTLNRKWPYVAIKRIINGFGGDVIYFRKDHLGHISCCSCCETQYPLTKISKVEVVRNQLVGLGAGKAIFLDLGVVVTVQHDEDRYTVIAFGTPEAEEFVSKLSRDGLQAKTELF